MVKCTLSCQDPSQRAEFDLSDCLMDMSSIDFSKCAAVFEDGSYEIFLNVTNIIRLMLNLSLCVLMENQ